ncbi:hypothetical protein [Sulfitobacter sp. MF3-043]|uniref:hypothetical protein n=1 Tax=Sulfitobacter sediminivivens TaxID=3252902 RepID=UPI003EB6F11B
MQVTTIGLDLAKNVFQVHGITGSRQMERLHLTALCGALRCLPLSRNLSLA